MNQWMRGNRISGIFILLLFAAVAKPCWASENDASARMEGEVRYRLEMRNNFTFNDGSYEDDAIHLIRTRLGIGWDATPQNLHLFVQGQDAQSFAQSSLNQGTGFVNRLDLRQLYAEWTPVKAEGPVIFKVGRQELAYGDERFVGAFNWSNVARVFDAAKVRWVPAKNLWIDAWASQVVLIDRVKADSADHGQDFYGLYAGWKPMAEHLLDSFLLVRHDRDNELRGEVTSHRGQLKEATVGNRFKGKRGGLDYGLEWAYQFGSRAHEEILAWALHTKAGYTFGRCPWKPRVGLEFNHGSGDGDSSDGEVNNFSNLFPTNHIHYGYMDFASLRNMNNLRFSVETQPHGKWRMELSYHAFFLDSNKSAWFNAGEAVIRPATPGASRTVGQEIDLLANWKVSKQVGLLAGYSHFFAGPFVDDSGADDDADFFYLQTTLKF